MRFTATRAKTLATSLLIVTAGLGLAACSGSSSSDSTTPATKQTAGKTSDGGVADVQPIACLEVTGRNYEAEVSSLYVNMHKAAAILKNDQLLEKHIRHQLSNYLPIISGARMMKDYLKFIFPKPQIQPKKEPQIKRIPIQ